MAVEARIRIPSFERGNGAKEQWSRGTGREQNGHVHNELDCGVAPAIILDNILDKNLFPQTVAQDKQYDRIKKPRVIRHSRSSGCSEP